MSLCIETFGAECYAFVTYSVMINILNSIQVSSLLFLQPMHNKFALKHHNLHYNI